MCPHSCTCKSEQAQLEHMHGFCSISLLSSTLLSYQVSNARKVAECLKIAPQSAPLAPPHSSSLITMHSGSHLYLLYCVNTNAASRLSLPYLAALAQKVVMSLVLACCTLQPLHLQQICTLHIISTPLTTLLRSSPPLLFALLWLLCFHRVGPARPEVQTLALAYWSLHYAKRIAETFLVHR